MHDIVFCGDNGQLVTTSLKVAEVFGKEHNKVVRDIENLSCSATPILARLTTSMIKEEVIKLIP